MTIDPPNHAADGTQNAISDINTALRVCARAEADPNGFWLEQAQQRLVWRKVPTEGMRGDFHSITEAPIGWFADGRLNITESCLDRHVTNHPDKTAILWEGDEPGDVRRISYAELHAEVCRTAGALRSLGVKPGERVIIYMGMVPEAAIAMLACARLGAVHSVVFGGFSAEALRDRVRDCGAQLVITQDEGRRGGRTIPLKAITDQALEGERGVDKVLVFQRTGGDVGFVEGRDVWWHNIVPQQSATLPAEEMEAEDPLFILYTSGSTGRPKGQVHTCGGYLTFAAFTHETVFDLRPDDVYGCVADVGWITGHTYIVYGPLCNGATTLMFESTPLYPDPGRYWDMVERHKISVFYTAPTAIRALAACDVDHVKRYDRSSLRVLGTVGEPINPEAWLWYFEEVGDKRCAVVDTWWQTETGGICISGIAPATPAKPGAASFPLPGIHPLLLDEDDHRIFGPGQGRLFLEHPWPGMTRTIWGDQERFVDTYFKEVPGLYFAGDGCRRDEDGYYWITGRVDDVLNVSGHRMGTAEFESALVVAEAVAEAAVVGFPHEIKGQGVHAFVVLQDGEGASPELEAELGATVRKAIGAHARLDRLQFVPGLPKTRSGKVMRRILRSLAHGQTEFGDVSTLADPSVVGAIQATNPA